MVALCCFKKLAETGKLAEKNGKVGIWSIGLSSVFKFLVDENANRKKKNKDSKLDHKALEDYKSTSDPEFNRIFKFVYGRDISEMSASSSEEKSKPASKVSTPKTPVSAIPNKIDSQPTQAQSPKPTLTEVPSPKVSIPQPQAIPKTEIKEKERIEVAVASKPQQQESEEEMRQALKKYLTVASFLISREETCWCKTSIVSQ